MLTYLHAVVVVTLQPILTRIRREESGQTVAEYALVLLVAAAIAAAFLVWAKQSGKLDEFFNAVFSKLLGSVDSQATPAP